jgi:hypothetical protein
VAADCASLRAFVCESAAGAWPPPADTDDDDGSGLRPLLDVSRRPLASVDWWAHPDCPDVLMTDDVSMY